MHTFSLQHIAKGIVLLCFLFAIISCGSNPHRMQYLINRNYLSNVGLTKSSTFLDMKGEDKIKAIHVGNIDHIDVENYMIFDEKGHLLSVRKERGKNEISTLVEFKYDKPGRLKSIVPNTNYFSALNYDSLNIIYSKGKPIESIAMKQGEITWTEDISFDDKNGEYLFFRKLENGEDELFNLYRFDSQKIIGEYHKNRIADAYIDSTNYFYEAEKLVKKTSIFNQSTTQLTEYDELGRPKKSTTLFLTADSIAWIDQYYYLLDDRLPHNITTVSPLGWTEETDYFWVK